MLDKTGTITLGNRQAVAFFAAPGVKEFELAEAAQLSSLADETPEGRSIVVLAKQLHQLRAQEVASPHAQSVPFTAQSRMSGIDFLNGAGGRALDSQRSDGSGCKLGARARWKRECRDAGDE